MKKILFILTAFALATVAIAQQVKLPVIISPKFNKDTSSIEKFGAIPDGKTLNTKSITAAIDAQAKKGGGVVFIPKGLWLTGPIVIKSNINLHLATGATLLFTNDKNEYPLVAANWEGLPQMRNQSPLSANGATNIAITGKGIIDGNGDAWRSVKKDKLNESQWKKLVASGGVVSEDKKNWFPSEQFMNANKMPPNPGQIIPGRNAAYYESIKDFLRPNLLLLTNCKYILLEGVTFQNSAAWCLHPLMSEHLTVRNISVKNPWYAQNGDGIDVESCKNVLIENSIFDVGDDALCMKSGRDEEGRKRGLPTENVIIRGCTVYASHGGFVIGSEMSGGARNMYISNCTFIGTDIGLRFKTTRGRGGIVENIFIKDIYMKDIPGEAILFDMYYAAKDPIPLTGEKRELPVVEFKAVDETTPIFKNFHISNVYCNGAAKAIFIRGIPEMHVKDIVLENMVLQADKGIDVQEATGITFKNIKIISKETSPVIDVVHSDKLIFDNITYKDGADLLFRISGERSNTINIKNTDASKAKEKIKYELGATEKSTGSVSPTPSQNVKWSERLSEKAMKLWPDSFILAGDKAAKWRYDQGVILKGIRAVWAATGDGKWFNYIQKCMDFYVLPDGSIKGYRPDEYNIDHVNNGKLLLLLFQVTGKEKYKKAADLLRNQLRTHPRTSEGGFWHKKIYPSQMWLDGLYMGQPFYAEYARLFHEDSAFNDIANQFILMEKHAIDKKTGLLYHGWDESKEQKWANKTTGQSPNFWGRSLGWYGMALVDVLDQFPANHPKREELIAILHRFAIAVRKVQDSKTGLWFDVPDKPDEPKNYVEASASCMLAYTFAKGARKGYLPVAYFDHARQAYRGIIKEFIETDANGQVNLKGTVAVSGLGGNPYRDGSFEYYMSEPVIVNDPKGMGAFIKCAAEMELNETQTIGKGKTVLLDYYFNNEWKKDITDTPVQWHYTWEDKTNSGYAMLGDIFTKFGVKTKSLDKLPNTSNLKGASIFIMVDPDTEKETERPRYINGKDAISISNWVKEGGVLVLLSNDAGNAEFKNFNQLARKFGIQFNEDSKNRVQNDQFEQGVVMTGTDNPVFTSNWKLYVKEYSSLTVTEPAIAIVKKDGHDVMAVAKYGKGTVFALGDPWIYNEYLDGRKLPKDFDNYKAAEDWVKWLIKQAK